MVLYYDVGGTKWLVLNPGVDPLDVGAPWVYARFICQVYIINAKSQWMLLFDADNLIQES